MCPVFIYLVCLGQPSLGLHYRQGQWPGIYVLDLSVAASSTHWPHGGGRERKADKQSRPAISLFCSYIFVQLIFKQTNSKRDNAHCSHTF